MLNELAIDYTLFKTSFRNIFIMYSFIFKVNPLFNSCLLVV